MVSLDLNDPLHWYLKELETIPPLTKEEEIGLLEHVQTKDRLAESARRRLIEGHLSLVASIAQRHSSTVINPLNLIEKGNEGLLFALNTFTGKSNFSAHAAACVEDAVVKALAELRSSRD